MIHPTAEVSPEASIGRDTQVWHQAQIREEAIIGCNCIIGKNVYIDFGVIIGDNAKVQNNSSIYRGAIIEDGVLVGPHVCLLNDKFPRAINASGGLKIDDDWDVGRVLVKYGASLGAGAIILPNVVVGRFAMVGAGAVVTKDVPDYGLVVGNPAKLVGYVDKAGKRLRHDPDC